MTEDFTLQESFLKQSFEFQFSEAQLLTTFPKSSILNV